MPGEDDDQKKLKAEAVSLRAEIAEVKNQLRLAKAIAEMETKTQENLRGAHDRMVSALEAEVTYLRKLVRDLALEESESAPMAGEPAS